MLSLFVISLGTTKGKYKLIEVCHAIGDMMVNYQFLHMWQGLPHTDG